MTFLFMIENVRTLGKERKQACDLEAGTWEGDGSYPLPVVAEPRS